ncbi:MAG: DUF2341 domain-containing protein [Candidatus Peribacteraceae bacterium]|nr:DUF2341 domain-containing protein [Candidatus Peribacteraceae bacterium]
MQILLIILIAVIGILTLTGLCLFYSEIRTCLYDFKKWVIRNWKKLLGVTLGGLVIGGGIMLPLDDPPADETTYYFDSYNVGEVWPLFPEKMVDGNTANVSITSEDADIELCDGNTYTSGGTGTITKVELRAYGQWVKAECDAILRPVFLGGDGDDHECDFTNSLSWGNGWMEITTDTNNPGTWEWSDVTALDCDVESITVGGGSVVQVARVEIRVTTGGAADPWWNGNYAYRKKINIANSDNNYQMFINVTKTSGGDVNCSAHCANDFDDIRFANLDGDTELDYWIEYKYDAVYALVWVELPSDVTSDNAIYIYYGYGSATAASDGDATFQYFDDWTSDNTGDWFLRWETGGGGNDTFHASIVVAGVADFDNVRMRYRMNRSNNYAPLNPHAGLRFGVGDNDTWDVTEQYPSNIVYWSDSYDAGCSDSTHNYYKMGARDDAVYTGGTGVCLTFTPTDYRVWDLLINGSAYTGLIKVYDDGYNFQETAVVTTTSALWPVTSTFDGILLGVYIDNTLGSGVHYWGHEAGAGDGALMIGGERDGLPADYNIAFIDWMFLGEFNPVEPSVSSVGDEEEPSAENNPPIVSSEYPGNNTWAVSGLTPTMHIAVSDADANLINITWSWYNVDGWYVFGENLSEASGSTYYQPFVNGTDYDRNYEWNVSVNDGEGGWDNETFYFIADALFDKDEENNPVLASGSSIICLSPNIAYDAEDTSWHLFYTRSVGGVRSIYRCDLTDVNQSSISYPGTLVLEDTGSYTFWICSILTYIDNNTAVYEDGKYWMYFADTDSDDIYYATADDLGGAFTIHSVPLINNSAQAWHATTCGRLGLTAVKDTDGAYILMYDGTHDVNEDHIGLATGTSKTLFTEYASNPVLAPAHANTGGEPPDQAWDDDWYEYPTLHRHNGTYVMVYTGQFYNTTGTTWGAERLGYATSDDLITWDKYDWNYVFNESHPDYSELWDNNDTSDPTLAIDANGTTTYLYYEGEESEVTNYYSIGRAWTNNFWDKIVLPVAYNTTVRTDDVDYFVWLGENLSAEDVKKAIGSTFNEAGETISTLNHTGHWDNYTGTGTGNNFAINTFDVVKIVLDDTAGTLKFWMNANSDMDYDLAGKLISLTKIANGYNYTGYVPVNSKTLSNANGSLDLSAGYFLALWNESNYEWDYWLSGWAYNIDKDIHQFDVVMTKIAEDRTWQQGTGA